MNNRLSADSGTVPALRELLRGSRWLLWIVGGLIGLAGLVHLVQAISPELFYGLIPTAAAPAGEAAPDPGPPAVAPWELAGAPIRWMLFVAGVVLTPTVLPVLVAHGLTRRAVARAGIAVAGIAAVAAGLLLAGGLLLERALVTGRTYLLANSHLFDSTSQVHLVFAEYALATATYFGSGWLVGTAYYRFGAVRGTVCLPLTALLPLAAVEVVLRGYLVVVPPWQAVLLGLAVVAACLVAARLLTRTIPLRQESRH